VVRFVGGPYHNRQLEVCGDVWPDQIDAGDGAYRLARFRSPFGAWYVQYVFDNFSLHLEAWWDERAEDAMLGGAFRRRSPGTGAQLVFRIAAIGAKYGTLRGDEGRLPGG